MKQHARRTVTLVAALVLASCATLSGIREFEDYRVAYQKAYETGSRILDVLADAERENFFIETPEATSTRETPFIPANAAYYTESVDPPGTAAFQRALDVVKSYNDLLYALATGEKAKDLTAKLSDFAAKKSAAVSETGAAAAAGGSVAAVSGTIGGALSVLTPAIEAGLTYRSRDEFRRFLRETHPAIKTILATLRERTVDVFPTLVSGVRRDARRTGFDEAKLRKIRTYRGLLSDWVVLLEAAEAALDTAVTSLDDPATVESALAGLSANLLEIELVVAETQKRIATLAND